jgi:hypothetical protein
MPWSRGIAPARLRHPGACRCCFEDPGSAAEGLRYVELTADPDNLLPPQKVILANGGRLIERFRRPGPPTATTFFELRLFAVRL